MPSVKVRDNEPFDFALRRFKRACEKAGVLLNHVNVSITKNQPRNESAKKRPLLNDVNVAWPKKVFHAECIN